MPLETFPVDVAEYLHNEERQAEYIALAYDSGDPAEIARATGVVARAKDMADVAKKSALPKPANA